MGKMNIILTNNNLKFTIHNMLLFPVVLKGLSHPELSHNKIKRNSVNFFKKLHELSKFFKNQKYRYSTS